MKLLAIALLGTVADAVLDKKILWWEDTSCRTKVPALARAMKDASFTAQRALMRVNSPGPYATELYELLFGPKTDQKALERVQCKRTISRSHH